MDKKNIKGITLIALIITIIILLILAGISIATLTGENGILTKSSKAKEESLIKQYDEEINLIIIDEITERKIQKKEEPFIQSLENKIKKKDWVETTKKCNETGIEQTPLENNNQLIITTEEGYEIIIEVDNEKLIAKIIDISKTDEIKEDKTELNLSITNNKIAEESNISINVTATKRLQKIQLKAQNVVIYSEENIESKTYNKTNIGIEQLKNLGQLPFYEDMEVTLEITTVSGTLETKTIENVKNYTVSTATQLIELATVVNSGNTLQGETIIQLANIDLKKEQWIPIGKPDKPFKGTYNGNYNIIDNLYINTISQENQGLFGCIVDSTVKNLILENMDINAPNGINIGGVVAQGEDITISRCGTSGTIEGYGNVGRDCGICLYGK